MVNLTKSNPDGSDDVDFTMASFDSATANIDAMLAVTFARNAKMMKFINKIYDADKDYYDLFKQADFEEERKEFVSLMPNAAACAKSLSEFFFRASIAGPDLVGLYQTWWDVAALDILPITFICRSCSVSHGLLLAYQSMSA